MNINMPNLKEHKFPILIRNGNGQERMSHVDGGSLMEVVAFCQAIRPVVERICASYERGEASLDWHPEQLDGEMARRYGELATKLNAPGELVSLGIQELKETIAVTEKLGDISLEIMTDQPDSFFNREHLASMRRNVQGLQRYRDNLRYFEALNCA